MSAQFTEKLIQRRRRRRRRRHYYVGYQIRISYEWTSIAGYLAFRVEAGKRKQIDSFYLSEAIEW